MTDTSRDETFADAVWQALRGDHNDLRKQQIIVNAHRAASQARPDGATEGPDPAKLVEALEKAKSALRKLQPALNVMARDVLDDIIANEIDAALTAWKGTGQ